VADVLATMRGRGFAALHYFEQMAPEVKEEAYVAVSGWLAAELPNMAAVASTSAAPEPAGWKQAGINSSLLLGGGLLLGAPVLALGAAVVGGVIGYRQAAEEIACGSAAVASSSRWSSCCTRRQSCVMCRRRAGVQR
jgi:hypothetical protein